MEKIMTGISGNYNFVFNGQQTSQRTVSNQATPIENIRARVFQTGEIEDIVASYSVVRYEGGMLENKMHGFGKIFFGTGSTLVGEFNQGYPVKGVLTYVDGHTYNGPYKNGKRHGEGVLTYPNQTQFHGTFVNGKKEGHGTTIYADGKQEKVNYINGKAVGDYEVNYPVGRDEEKYSGQILNGKRHGFGHLVNRDGSWYKGDFHEDIKHGQGRELTSTNIFREGSFVSGKMNGIGIECTANTLFIKGNFVENRKHGLMAIKPLGADLFYASFIDDLQIGNAFYYVDGYQVDLDV
jgi:hypothetical protein